MMFTDAELDQAEKEVRAQCAAQGVTFHLADERLERLLPLLLDPAGAESTDIDDSASAAAHRPAA